MADKVRNTINDTLNNLNNLKGNALDFLNGESYGAVAARVVIISLLVVLVIEILIGIYNSWKNYTKGRLWLYKGTRSARKGKIVLQDPKNDEAKTIIPSENEAGGLEFTYTLWMKIDNWSHQYGHWKHVFHKGNSSSWPLRAPGVFLHPTENKLRIYMNTYTQIGEWADVSNIPLKKWFHVAVAVKQRNLDIFINGNLIKRHNLSGLPKQNYGDIYLTQFKGYDGLLSNMRYFNYYLDFSELNNIVNIGPSSVMEESAQASKPPYLSYNWWANNDNNIENVNIASENADNGENPNNIVIQ